MRMGADDAACVLYRAPILFCTSGDFTYIRDEAVGVSAIGAIELFERIKIIKVVTVENEIVTAIYLAIP